MLRRYRRDTSSWSTPAMGVGSAFKINVSQGARRRHSSRRGLTSYSPDHLEKCASAVSRNARSWELRACSLPARRREMKDQTCAGQHHPRLIPGRQENLLILSRSFAFHENLIRHQMDAVLRGTPNYLIAQIVI